MELLIGVYEVRGLASPHPFLGATWVVVRALLSWLVLVCVFPYVSLLAHCALVCGHVCGQGLRLALRCSGARVHCRALLCAAMPVWARIALASLWFWCSCSLPCASVYGYFHIGKGCLLSVVLVLGCMCAAMSFGGESCSPPCAFVSAWDSVMPTKGIHFQFLPVPRRCWVCSMSCGGEVSLLMVLTTLHGTAFKPMKDKIHHLLLPVPDDVGCVSMLKDWISSCCVGCADNHNYFQFKLKAWVAVLFVQLHRCRSVSCQLSSHSCTSWRPGCSTLAWWSMSLLCGA